MTGKLSSATDNNKILATWENFKSPVIRILSFFFASAKITKISGAGSASEEGYFGT